VYPDLITTVSFGARVLLKKIESIGDTGVVPTVGGDQP
jgi:hypothetical protein